MSNQFVRVRALNACGKPGCTNQATLVVEYDGNRGWQRAAPVCPKHVGWGRALAEGIRAS